MTDLEPVEPSAVLPRAVPAPAAPSPWAGLSRGRAIVTRGRRLLAGGPLLPASALAVAAVAAVRAAERVARLAASTAGPVGGPPADRPVVVPVTRTTVQVSWTYVEVRRRR